MSFTVRAGEPDVTHRTSWPGSTGECSGRLEVIGQHCALKATILTPTLAQEIKRCKYAISKTTIDSFGFSGYVSIAYTDPGILAFYSHRFAALWDTSLVGNSPKTIFTRKVSSRITSSHA